MWKKKGLELRHITPTYKEGIHMYKKVCKRVHGKVLDAGCGANPERRDTLPTDIDYLGLDISTIVEKKSKLFKFVKGDLNKELKFKANQFDFVICWSVLEHIKNDNVALEQFYKVLKPNGELILQVPLKPSSWDYADIEGGHFRRYSYFKLKNELRKIGFTIEKRYFMRTGLIFLYKKLVRTNNKVRKERYYPDASATPVKLLKLLSPVFKIDKYIFSKWGHWGLNTVIIARKGTSIKHLIMNDVYSHYLNKRLKKWSKGKTLLIER